MKLNLVAFIPEPRKVTSLSVIDKEDLAQRIKHHGLDLTQADELLPKIEEFMEFFWEKTLYLRKSLDTPVEIKEFFDKGWTILPSNPILRKIVVEITALPFNTSNKNDLFKQVVKSATIHSNILLKYLSSSRAEGFPLSQYFTILSFYFLPEFIQSDLKRELFDAILESFKDFHIYPTTKECFSIYQAFTPLNTIDDLN